MVLAHNINEGQRTQDVHIKENITFESILLAENTLSGLKKAGFNKPSPIQLHGIPLGKCGFDLLLEAKSGTGKTVVFTVIALEKLDLQKGLQVIILAPTREIAAQICHVIKIIGSDYLDLNVEVVMGGLPMQEDILKFKTKLVHIVVGSPGRLKHLIIGKHLDISAVRLLVLDECDKLLEKSFLADINTIYSILPKQKQVIMSSATYPEKCKTFITKYVHNVQHICPDSGTILLGIAQKVTIVKNNNNIVKQTKNRFEELLKIITAKQFKQCLIFCNYQARVAELHKLLIREKWPAELLHGQQQQMDRLDALKTLQEYKCRILIATDLAARGIDASNVDLIVNFEPPHDWQTYLHRIGRAGRYGSYGTAISILSEGKEAEKFKEVFNSIDLSFNLQNLWTDDEFSINIQNEPSHAIMAHKTELTIPEKQKTPDQISKELWDFLIGENERDKKDYQTFEELQGSYELSCSSNNNSIEMFTDLVASFKESHELNINNKECVEYAHLIADTFPINDYLRYIETESNSLQISVDDICHTEHTTEIANSPSYVESEVGYKECLNDLSLELGNNKENKSHSNQPFNIENHKTNILLYTQENNSNHKKTTSNCDNLKDNAKALLDAGLPTSFGRTYNNINKYHFARNKSGKKDSNRKEDIFSNKNFDKAGNKETSILKLQSQQETNSRLTNQPKNNKRNHRSSLNKLYSSNIFKESYCNISSHSRHKGNGIEFNYNYEIWLYQLKTHVKYIEYVIYNQELCKL